MSPLCCCEFVDGNEKRRHLLEICCNCVIVDDAFNRCISCQPVENNLFQKLYKVLAERLRMPVCDGRGSRKILPPLIFITNVLHTKVSVVIFLLTLGALLIAAQGLILTFVVLCLVFIFVTLHHLNATNSLRNNSRVQNSDILFVGALSIFTWIFIVFEFQVVPFLEIKFFENTLLMLLLMSGLVPFYLIRIEHEWRKVSSTQIERHGICSTCEKVKSTQTERHSIWLNVCIDSRYEKSLWAAMIMLVIGITYGCILTLTTICFSKLHFSDRILLPYNCTDVYVDLYVGMSFSCVIFAATLGFLVILKLLKKLFSHFLFSNASESSGSSSSVFEVV